MENKNSDYIIIYQWMGDLFPAKKGKPFDYVKLLLFAYIYSYSRDGKNKWFGTQQQLAELCHCSDVSVCNKLKELVDDGFIIKEEVQLYGMFLHNNYFVNPEYLPSTTVEQQSTG